MDYQDGRYRSSIPRAGVVFAILFVVSGIGTTGAAVAADGEDVTIVEYDLPEEMERGESYAPTGTIENDGDETVTVMLEYQFDGEPAIGVEEELGAGESVTAEVWGVSIDDIEEWRMTEIPAGTYDHGLAVLVEDERGTLEEVDAVSERVEVLGSADDGAESGDDGGATTTASDADETDVDRSSADLDDPVDGETRGFFSNDPNSSFAFLDDPAALTWIGILVSIVGIVAQLAWRN